jgi:phosphoribosyl-ATP pyrophosphohydrolase/phosphoribosyl-AMP cyclohydrolase/histidinol dehydrogenase
METVIPLPLLPHLDLTKGPPFPGGLIRPQIGYFGAVYFTLGDNEVEKLFRVLQRHGSIQAYINATQITSTDVIVSILDAGVHMVFIDQLQLESLISYGDRVALVISDDETENTKSAAGGVLISCGEDLSACKVVLKKYKEAKTPAIFLFPNPKSNLQAYADLAREESVIALIPPPKLTMENVHSNDKLSVPAFLAASWTTDRDDHLIPTIVTDERGIALGLVYSSQESLSESLKTGTGQHIPWHTAGT